MDPHLAPPTPGSTPLTAAQRAALAHVAARSQGPALPPGPRLTINLHPDRLTREGTPLLRALAASGRYLPQFATGTGNGGLTAHPGGARWAWETRIFGGAYDRSPPEDRPLYAALDTDRLPNGAAPRFGSAHLRLRPALLERSSFCFPDSAAEPTDFGVAAAMPLLELAAAGGRDALDAYIEAQVHGPLLLERDVEALVLDPCFRGTAVEVSAAALPFALEWHAGYRVAVAELAAHGAYRGPAYVALSARIGAEGMLDPGLIGAALHSGQYDPQDLKKVWHLLARFGAPEPHTGPAAPRQSAERTGEGRRAGEAPRAGEGGR